MLTRAPHQRGCVSGSQLQNLKDECDKGGGNFDFDAIDGYEEITCVLQYVSPKVQID